MPGAILRAGRHSTVTAVSTRFDVIAANGLIGTFGTIDAGNVKVRPVYTGSALSVVVE